MEKFYPLVEHYGYLIVFFGVRVGTTGIPWEMLPQEMDCGSGMTCWWRLKEWHERVCASGCIGGGSWTV